MALWALKALESTLEAGRALPGVVSSIRHACMQRDVGRVGGGAMGARAMRSSVLAPPPP